MAVLADCQLFTGNTPQLVWREEGVEKDQLVVFCRIAYFSSISLFDEFFDKI